MTSKHFVSAIAAFAALSAASQAFADTSWDWHYTGAGVDAAGTFTIRDAADAAGFHQIVAITGSRNGEAITGLYPTGAAIPGNEPYALDNLFRFGAQGQITVHGFGFATSSGGHANPYFADFLATPSYMEVFTTSSSFSEVPVTFTASAAVPEPESILLALAGLGTVGMAASSRRRAA